MRIIELYQVPKNRRGSFHNNGVRLELHEEGTARFLALYGFNIEVICPNNTPKIKNPDILMSGTIWEMKAPTKYNKNTLKKKVRKASMQAQRVVYDLRNAGKDHDELQKAVIKLYEGNSNIRRMILITKDKKVLEFFKR